MPVRRQFTVLFLLAMLFGAGCSRNDDAALVPETEDSNYKHGKQLQRHGRSGEALNAFLKVIETRGTRAAPESHLEAGVIYLHHSKNPIEAIHHFGKYLELRPNSAQAPHVRELVNTATREFALRLPARPFDDQAVRLAENREIEKLRRENEEMRAELATLRGRSAGPANRFSQPAAATDAQRRATAASPLQSPISLAPPQAAPSSGQSTGGSAQLPARAAPSRVSGRTHTVAQGESPWSIARLYYGSGTTNARVQALIDANRNQLPQGAASMKPGMVLRIP